MAKSALKKRLEEAGLALESSQTGPKAARSLVSRRAKLVLPENQLRLLENLSLTAPSGERADFAPMVDAVNRKCLYPGKLEIFQVNVGKLCNMGCRHCHMDAGPDRWDQMMTRETAKLCVQALDRCGCHTVDITGGAPELNPNFEYLVAAALARGKHVIDRCNLTILLLPTFEHLPEWLAERGVEVVCSLPHSQKRNTDALRGEGTFEKSIEALRRLNKAGYGKGDPHRVLTIMSNPAGAFLAGKQNVLQKEWRTSLQRQFGVTFDRLITLNNMPIARYLEWLEASNNLRAYMDRLLQGFNPTAVNGLMCRNTISIGWDGRVFDCDFNQALELQTCYPDGSRCAIADLDFERLQSRRIRTARHCFGCTAGHGSSCGGATA